jgi:hypothetical protein
VFHPATRELSDKQTMSSQGDDDYDDAEFERKQDYFLEIKGENGFSSHWVIYEVKDMHDRHPFGDIHSWSMATPALMKSWYQSVAPPGLICIVPPTKQFCELITKSTWVGARFSSRASLSTQRKARG